jgi:hypothetical protein
MMGGFPLSSLVDNHPRLVRRRNEAQRSRRPLMAVEYSNDESQQSGSIDSKGMQTEQFGFRQRGHVRIAD